MPGYQSVLVEQQADGTAVTNTTAETSILNAAARISLPTGYLNRVGKGLFVRAGGRISNIVTTPGTLTLKFKLGSVAVATSQAFALNVVAKTNVTWALELHMLVRSIGSGTSATIFPTGIWTSESVVGSPLPSAGAPGGAAWQAATPVVGGGFDSSAANQIDLTATWSLANANSIQCHTFALEDLTTTP